MKNCFDVIIFSLTLSGDLLFHVRSKKIEPKQFLKIDTIAIAAISNKLLGPSQRVKKTNVVEQTRVTCKENGVQVIYDY